MLSFSPIPPRRKPGFRAFTLLELLVSLTILSLIIVLLLSMITNASTIWLSSSAKVDAFQSARMAFDTLTRKLSQATLNTYIGYDDSSNATRYLRQSELKFTIGLSGSGAYPGTPGTGQVFFFVAPASYTLNTSGYCGMESLLNVCGYYVSFSTNNTVPAHVKANQVYRYRLMQLIVPTEQNSVYTSSGNAWFTDFVASSYPAADNIIALFIRPQDPDPALASPDLTADYTCDSTLNATANPQPVTANQLPPIMQVTMVAIDEAFAKRAENGSTPPAKITAALAGKFTVTSEFENDLSKLEMALQDAKIPYRVFSSAVAIRESKWTK
ncbi:MAG: prepilin-type N-terminal cleavage/methylation domain-containing protein [Chthoniobacteraceae bacterium]